MIWKLGRTVCVYSMVQRREKEKDSRYIQEASAPAAVTVYQTCNIMYICNNCCARHTLSRNASELEPYRHTELIV